MATVPDTTAPSTRGEFWRGEFWTDFQAGIELAKRDLPRIADDMFLFPRIVANPDAYGLDRPGLLAGYVGRVAESVWYDPEIRKWRAAKKKAAGGPSGASDPR
jgi:hypothetical protein